MNIEKIIFDMDNTLIIWKDEYIRALEETIKYFNINVEPKIIDSIIESLEKNHTKIDKKTLLNDINKKCNLNLDINFIDMLFEKQKLLAPYDEELIDTIKYLSKKYKLALLTNYFKEVQKGRLETAKIASYFTEIYGAEDIILKPNKNAFLTACNHAKPENCIMIGDSFDYDIKEALNLNMKVIQVDYFNKIREAKNYPVIKKIKELKKIL